MLADQLFSAHWQLSCEQCSLPFHIGCMHLHNCHPCHRACTLTNSTTLASLLGGVKINCCLLEAEVHQPLRLIKSISLQNTLPSLIRWLVHVSLLISLPKAMVPLLPWLAPFCAVLQERNAPTAAIGVCANGTPPATSNQVNGWRM